MSETFPPRWTGRSCDNPSESFGQVTDYEISMTQGAVSGSTSWPLNSQADHPNVASNSFTSHIAGSIWWFLIFIYEVLLQRLASLFCDHDNVGSIDGFVKFEMGADWKTGELLVNITALYYGRNNRIVPSFWDQCVNRRVKGKLKMLSARDDSEGVVCRR